MKLLYITNGINGSGGLERVLSVKASALVEDFGYQVTILVLNNADQNPFYHFNPNIGFRSIKVGGNSLQYWKSYRKGIQSVVNDIHPDIISVCDDGLKGFFLPLILGKKIPIVYERHVSKLIESKGTPSFFTTLKWNLMERLGKNFTKFIVLTEGNQNEWKSLKNIKVIPNPLSFELDRVSTLENKSVICVGKISYQKGQDLLVEAWQEIFQRFPDWKLELYGKEDDHFLNVKDLQHLNIFWFPPNPQIEEKYLQSSINVMSSRFEGFGMVLIEAMECGVPCISFNCPYGPSDIITNEKDGFLIENGNIQKLKEQLIELIENQELRKEMGKNAKKNVQRFSAKEIVKQWDQLFKTLSS